MTQVMAEVLRPTCKGCHGAVRSSFAAEVCARKPTALCLAGSNEAVVKKFQAAS